MIFKRLLLTTLLLGLFILGAQAQGSAQATMKVSVEVIKATGIEVVLPETVEFIKAKKQALATLNFNGVNARDLMVSAPKSLLLTNKKGYETEVQIFNLLKKAANGTAYISLEAMLGEETARDIYSGVLTTTVEYL